MKQKLKQKPLIKRGNLTNVEIILKSGEKFKGIIHIQKTRKEDKLTGEVVSFERNPNKMVFYESDKDSMQFTQLSCYTQKPFQFMIVAGNRYIILPFDSAFSLKKGLEEYLDFVKSISREDAGLLHERA